MVVQESILRDILRLIVWYPVRWIVHTLPLRRAFAFLYSIGDIHFFLSGRKNWQLLKNLQSVSWNKKLSLEDFFSIIKNYYRNHYVNQLQIFIFPRLNAKNIGKVHDFRGLEHLDGALKKGRGCILLHAHFGPTQLPLHALGLLGYTAVQLGLPTDEGLSFIGRHVAFKLRLRYEKKILATILPATSFLRPLFEALKKNCIVLMTGDGAGKTKFIGKVVTEDFLGVKTFFTPGAQNLAEKTGAAVVPMFTFPENKKYITAFHEQLNINGNNENVIRDFAKLMQEYVQKYPYLWHFWDEFDRRIAGRAWEKAPEPKSEEETTL